MQPDDLIKLQLASLRGRTRGKALKADCLPHLLGVRGDGGKALTAHCLPMSEVTAAGDEEADIGKTVEHTEPCAMSTLPAVGCNSCASRDLTEHIWCNAGRLGIQIGPGHSLAAFSTAVLMVSETIPQGSVRVGQYLTSIDGEDLTGQSFQEVRKRITTKSRPLRVTFCSFGIGIERRLRELFLSSDRKRSGGLDPSELAKVLEYLEISQGRDVDDRERVLLDAADAIARFDLDGSGEMEFEVYLRFAFSRLTELPELSPEDIEEAIRVSSVQTEHDDNDGPNGRRERWLDQMQGMSFLEAIMEAFTHRDPPTLTPLSPKPNPNNNPNPNCRHSIGKTHNSPAH